MRYASLVRHPSSALTPAIEIDAAAVPLRSGAVSFRYRVRGDVGRIRRMPPPGPSARQDELWRHTCFEAFVRFPRSDRYVELNFAPSSAWAAYELEGYRRGMRPWLQMDAPVIQCRTDRDSIAFDATVKAPFFERGSALGLAAVIEDVDLNVSFWALDHPNAQPDFHAAAGWIGAFQPSSAEDRE